MGRIFMKRLLFLILLATEITSFAYAASNSVKIGIFPTISNASPKLRKSLDALKTRVGSDAQDCLENARGMGSVGEYEADFKKMIDTSKAVVLQVSGSKICDGVHTTSYQYGIAFDKATGKRIDLNQIYNIANRQDGRLFVRPELVDALKASYAKANEHNPSCLSEGGWEDELTNVPVTFAPLADGSIVLYFAAPDVSAACFSSMHLDSSAFSKFRDANRASQYELP
jgi:hypothetical protein